MRVHHVKFLCKDLVGQVNRFCRTFGFQVCGKWKDVATSSYPKIKNEWIVLQKENVSFALGQETGPMLYDDHVCDVALEVDSVSDTCSKIRAEGGEVIQQPVYLGDDENSNSHCELAIVRSPAGKVRHTLLNKNGYHQSFLPGFQPLDNELSLSLSLGLGQSDPNSVHHDVAARLDHITFAVNNGTSFDFMNWYEKCLRFKRFQVNSEEEQEGFIVKTKNDRGLSLGMRLTAMQYHFCSEEFMDLPDSNYENNVKFVFAESLPGKGPNQIDTFLSENKGPGIQHIGLHTSDIVQTTNDWKNNGAAFIVPPRHYYDEIEHLIAKFDDSQPHSMLKKHGILLDVEEPGRDRYLFQVFMKPIFDKNTFFFELIQRHGATGFGAGNISALWRAVDAYLQERKSAGGKL